MNTNTHHCFEGKLIHIMDIVKEKINFRCKFDAQSASCIVILT